jgi:enoyl-CoA hydratase/carnithine racemase
MAEEVLLSKKDHTALVTLNRPEAMNTMSSSLCFRLRETLEELDQDDDTWVIIITGSGERAFCAGIDLKERKFLDKRGTEELRRKAIFPLLRTLDRMTKPMIAAVNGVALGGGCEIALDCDLRIAAENATFGQTEIRWGIIASGGACQRMPRIVGMGRAKELLLTGRVIDAREAERIGLVNRVVPLDRLLEAANELAEEIKANAPVAVRQTKRCIDVGANLEMALAFDAEASWYCYQTEDRLEALAAFAEKRKPNFKGR